MYVYHTQVLISIHIYSFRNEDENNSCKNHLALKEQNSFTLLFLVIEEGKEFPTYFEIIVNYIVMLSGYIFLTIFSLLRISTYY